MGDGAWEKEVNIMISFGCLLKRITCILLTEGLAPRGKHILSFRVGLFSEGALCAGKQTGSNNSCLPCNNWPKIYQVYEVPLFSSLNLDMSVISKGVQLQN